MKSLYKLISVFAGAEIGGSDFCPQLFVKRIALLGGIALNEGDIERSEGIAAVEAARTVEVIIGI